MVGGRSYNQSQFNHVTAAHRQPGSVFKPFVYLAAFEQALADGRTDLSPAMIVADEPTTFLFDDKDYAPGNYDGEYEGPITLRHALARSRNIATIKVAEMIGFDKVADLWRRLGVGTPPQAYPSIALGVFEATPLEVATAYTIFTNGGQVRPVHSVQSLLVDGNTVAPPPLAKGAQVAKPETTYLVTSMMQSVLDEGTGASARSSGFKLEAAGKSGTTNDQRDAWFVGFTPELLTVVWVGIDDNTPLGMTGSQAALPIWTSFMARALAGRQSSTFEIPDGLEFADIDPDSGGLAMPELSEDPSRSVPAGQRADRGLHSAQRWIDILIVYGGGRHRGRFDRVRSSVHWNSGAGPRRRLQPPAGGRQPDGRGHRRPGGPAAARRGGPAGRCGPDAGRSWRAAEPEPPKPVPAVLPQVSPRSTASRSAVKSSKPR